MKCLEKERNRRYESASALARDIERHLSDEPVQACPPTKWYRLRKLARRNKGIFAIASAAATVVLLGMIALAASNYLIRQEQARTKDEKDRAERAQLLAENRADEIRRGMDRLNAANAWLERGRSDVAQRHWDDASAAFTKAVELRPDHVAALLERGDLFALLGLWDLARADFARAFELREPDATMRWYRHALLCLSFGDAQGYRQLRSRMRERFRGTITVQFAAELLRTCALGSDPDDDLELSVELAQNAADANPGSWISLYILGITQYRAGQHEQAVRRLRESLTALPDSSARALSYPVLAMALHHRGQATEARQALRDAAEAIDGWMNEVYGRAQGNGWVAHEGLGTPWPIPWWDWVEFQLYYREAKLLIDGTVPSDDPRLHVLRARAFAAMQRGPAADVEFATALTLRPDDTQVRFEAHRSAAYTAVARRDWGRTAAEFTKASELAPDDAKLLHLRAMALLGAGDIEGYRKVCLATLERYEKTADAGVAGDVVYYSVMRHDTLPEMTRLLPLARLASPLNSNRPDILGAALYRVGRYDESVQCLEKAVRMSRPRACEWTFLAMGHHRLGHPDEARRCLAEAARWIEEANRQTDDDLSGTRAVWARWYEPVVIPLLLREAEALLGDNAPERS